MPQVKCTQCSHCSNKFDPFLDLSLDIGKATSLVRALQNFTAEELLDGGEKQYQCQRCRKKVVAKKKFTIDKAPYVLTIHLKRFSPFNPREKIDKKVDFQPMLDLKPFISDSKVSNLVFNSQDLPIWIKSVSGLIHYCCFCRAQILNTAFMVFWFMLVGIHSQVTIIALFGLLVAYGTILMITRLFFFML